MFRPKGQITIYLAITFALMTSMFLGCYEAARANALSVYMECALEMGLNSAFAEYNKALLDRFDLMYIDMSYLSNQPDSDKLANRINEYVSDTMDLSEDQSILFVRDLFNVTASNVDLTGYRLATDNFGASFKSQAVNYIEAYVPVDFIDTVNKWATARNEYKLTQESFEKTHDDAIEELEDGFKNAAANHAWTETVINKLDADVYLFSAVDVMVFGIDGMLNERSAKGINLSDTVSFRNKNNGCGDFELDAANPFEEILFDEYIMDKFGCYTKTCDDSALDYEIEYIIYGTDSDMTNLSFCITELFFVRAAATMVTIYKDEDKMKIIEGVAEGLSSICKYVPKEAWEAAIMCTWSCFESVSDVKHLFKGERIPLIKDGEDMRVSLTGLYDLITEENGINENSQMTEDDQYELGLTYRDYLRIFLLTTPPLFKTYRAMDMIEQDIRQQPGNEFFRFDACTDAVSVIETLQSGFGHEMYAQRKYYYY